MKKHKQSFVALAKDFIVRHLERVDKASGETIVSTAKTSGLVPENDKSFGPAFRSLSVKGVIQKCGTCRRQKGHRSSGGHIWKLKN